MKWDRSHKPKPKADPKPIPDIREILHSFSDASDSYSATVNRELTLMTKSLTRHQSVEVDFKTIQLSHAVSFPPLNIRAASQRSSWGRLFIRASNYVRVFQEDPVRLITTIASRHKAGTLPKPFDDSNLHDVAPEYTPDFFGCLYNMLGTQGKRANLFIVRNKGQHLNLPKMQSKIAKYETIFGKIDAILINAKDARLMPGEYFDTKYNPDRGIPLLVITPKALNWEIAKPFLSEQSQYLNAFMFNSDEEDTMEGYRYI